MKKLLILGGTQFVGRNLVETLLAESNFDITLFNRQQTNPDLFPEIKKIKGDRETAHINKITDQSWDLIIDISGYYPNTLADLLKNIKGNVGQYIFISTLSVCNPEKYPAGKPVAEDVEIHSCTQAQRKDTSIETYASRKAECERVLQQTHWLDTTILRPSVIYGKYDTYDRLYYWIYRIKKELRFILPDEGKQQMNLTYIGDLVNIIIKAMGIKNHSTVYNVPTHQPVAFKKIIEAIENSLAQKANTVNSDSKTLLDNKLIQGYDIPLWFPFRLIYSNEKLVRDFGLKLTSFQQSINETVSYYDTLKWPAPTFGISVQKENELIKKITER